jgi:hypothetical protein
LFSKVILHSFPKLADELSFHLVISAVAVEITMKEKAHKWRPQNGPRLPLRLVKRNQFLLKMLLPRVIAGLTMTA